MKLKTFLFLAISFTTLFVACKKDKDDVIKNTSAKIRGEWKIDSIVMIENFNNNLKKTNHQGTPADFIDFKTDGKMYTSFQGNNNTSSYIVHSDNRIIINGDAAYIEALSDTQFILFTKAEAGSIGYIQMTYYLRR